MDVFPTIGGIVFLLAAYLLRDLHSSIKRTLEKFESSLNTLNERMARVETRLESVPHVHPDDALYRPYDRRSEPDRKP
jgi:uncharacterized sporulation protein YeaH/YhbH (DUF444 family)